MIRISLILAILLGLAAGIVNFVVVKEKVTTLQTNYKNEQDAHTKTRGELATKTKELGEKTKELETTKATLEDTTKQRDDAVAAKDKAEKNATALTEQLKKTTAEKDDAQQKLAAYLATGWPPERILAADKEVKGLQDKLAGALEENLVLGKELKKTKDELAFYKDPEFHIVLPSTLKGKVLLPDPKWGFVLLNIGDKEGVEERSEFLVHRSGQLVAKVRVTKVDKDRCVANVMPGWGQGEDILEGDMVIPAYTKL